MMNKKERAKMLLKGGLTTEADFYNYFGDGTEWSLIHEFASDMEMNADEYESGIVDFIDSQHSFYIEIIMDDEKLRDLEWDNWFIYDMIEKIAYKNYDKHF